MEQLEKIKVVALYDGYTEDQIQCEDWCGCNVLMNINPDFMPEDMQMIEAAYDKSWHWQIPVWSKAIKEANSIAIMKNIDLLQVPHGLSQKYYGAIDNKDVLSAFDTLYELIIFIDKHKNK